MKVRRIFSGIVLWYLKWLSKIQLLKVRPKTVGVGGASGKTSLSHFLNLILASKYKLRETEGKNSQTGIPLSILGIKLNDYTYLEWLKAIILAPLKVLLDFSKFDLLVAELGIDSPFEPSNMSYLLKIVKPQIAVLTNINFEHSENFDSEVKETSDKARAEKILDLTTKEEGLLLTTLAKKGIAVLNLDDPKIRKLKKDIKANLITVSTKDKKADFVGSTFLNGKFKLNIQHKGKKYTLLLGQPLPVHFAVTFLLAIAVCESLGIKIEDSIRILRNNFSLPAGRFSIFPGIKNTKILDSSYNSSLAPALDALSVLSKMTAPRKVAIIGDMRELGTISKMQHESLAKKLTQCSDLAILIGPLTSEYVAPILKEAKLGFYSFLTFSQSKNTIKKVIKPGDVILVKGSQNTLYLERAVGMLLLNPKDKSMLCRRGKFWDRKRKENE